MIQVPRGVIHFSLWCRNLGVITSLRLGHDNVGGNPNWLIEHVLVRNEFTGHTFKFACGRWLGAGQDDGSCERYMVGHPVHIVTQHQQRSGSSSNLLQGDDDGDDDGNGNGNSNKVGMTLAQLVATCARPPRQPLPTTGIRSVDPERETVELQVSRN